MTSPVTLDAKVVTSRCLSLQFDDVIPIPTVPMTRDLYDIMKHHAITPVKSWLHDCTISVHNAAGITLDAKVVAWWRQWRHDVAGHSAILCHVSDMQTTISTTGRRCFRRQPTVTAHRGHQSATGHAKMSSTKWKHLFAVRSAAPMIFSAMRNNVPATLGNFDYCRNVCK